MAKFKVNFTATIPADSDNEYFEILGGTIVLSVDVEVGDAPTLMERFQRIIEDIKMHGLEKYRFEVYTLVGNDKGELVGLLAAD